MADYKLQGFENETFNEFMLVATHPAPVGTHLVYAHKDGSSHRVPVVLWGVLQDGSPVPITMSGVWDGVQNDNVFILHPDGYCSALERSWTSLEEAVGEMKSMDEPQGSA
ncbi:MAG TPA: hypothetical protein VF631_06605 [Allosphingosinicella sp.]|uniref:hypothetical protein n=1 Tax=Allosphingosinicella sp. TaxID=2823234 RepID=UPI002F28E0AE